MKRIALAVGEEFKNATVEDKLLADSLRSLGFDAQPLVWDAADSTSDCRFDAVVVQSCWGYHKQPEKFLRWIAGLKARGVSVFNPPDVLHWNHDKIYLRDLAARGVRLPPTVWIEIGGKGDLKKIPADNRWRKAVLKPTVSATAWRTFVVTPENAAKLQPEFESLLETGGAIVQKFVAEIETKGEWSFVFFDKKFSHACLKRAKAGDFRVQSNFGGTIETNVQPPSALIGTAQKIVSAVNADLLYARVDVVETDGDAFFMELELIEPVLFLENNPAAAQKFARAIASRFE